ncbi:MAG: hypothetical protein QOE90_2523 [Thermoplasmata archaeon]|jgi:MFS family permease|nr:hypothetical protein [Thermoplasmata archaeon]
MPFDQRGGIASRAERLSRPRPARRAVPRFPRNVVALSITSFLADVSGEMLMAVLPFLLLAQGATGFDVGITGGVSDAVGHLLKPVFGALADRTRRRKPLVVGGYLLAASARFGISASTQWFWSLAYRSADRVGKGMRTAPRDAILAESATKETRGRSFGLHRAADTAGAVVGVGLALLALLVLRASDASIVFVGALIGLSTAIPLFFVRDEGPLAPAAAKAIAEPLSPRYRRYLVVAAIFAAGNVSYLFFVLRASDAVGGAVGAVALYLVFNVVYAAGAYPMGALSDRVGKPRVLAAGFLLFALAAALMAMPPTWWRALAAFVVMGGSFACVDGVERAFAADLAGSVARSTRLGVFQGVVGVATVLSGIAAGLLWDQVAPWAAFAWGAGVALVALAALALGGFLR